MRRNVTQVVVAAAFCCVLLLAGPAIAGAQIIMGEEIKFDFTKPETLKERLDYSDHDKLALSEKGLGWEAKEGQILSSAWFQTTAPIPLGYAWTPTAGVTIHAHLDVDFPYIGANSLGVLYVRYSPDTKNWSAWQALEGDRRPDKSRLTHDYSGAVIIPQRDRTPYYALLQEFYKLHPESAGDEEDAVRWIVKNDPHYFEKTLPFVGYIQFLFESPLHGGEHLKSMHNLVIWTLPGIHTRSKREREYDAKKPSPWQYRATP